MSETITFFHNPMSRGRVAHWMLEEVGVPYEVQLLDFASGEHKKAEYTALNPMGKIPAIVHRGVVITETAAIVAYLADAFPAAGLAPAIDDPRRGSYLRWLFFGAGCIEPAIVDKMLVRPPVERRGALGYGSYEDTMATLEKALTPGPFLTGDQFTAADLYIASMLSWGMMTKTIEPTPITSAYARRAADRSAAKRAMEKNAALAAQLKSGTH
jgi:glutathione S-transferase